jgi:hypothetical protein
MGRIHVCDACVAPCDDPESQMVVTLLKWRLSNLTIAKLLRLDEPDVWKIKTSDVYFQTSGIVFENLLQMFYFWKHLPDDWIIEKAKHLTEMVKTSGKYKISDNQC